MSLHLHSSVLRLGLYSCQQFIDGKTGAETEEVIVGGLEAGKRQSLNLISLHRKHIAYVFLPMFCMFSTLFA